MTEAILHVTSSFENTTFNNIKVIFIDLIDSYELFKNCAFKNCTDVCVIVNTQFGVGLLPSILNVISIKFEFHGATIMFDNKKIFEDTIIKSYTQIFHCDYGYKFESILQYFEEKYFAEAHEYSIINSKNEIPKYFVCEEEFTIVDSNDLVIGKAKCLPKLQNLVYETILKTSGKNFYYDGDVTSDGFKDILDVPSVILEKFESFETIYIKGTVSSFLSCEIQNITIIGNIQPNAFSNLTIKCDTFFVDGSILSGAFNKCSATIDKFEITGSCFDFGFIDTYIDTLKVQYIGASIGSEISIVNLKCVNIADDVTIAANRITLSNSSYGKNITFAGYIEICGAFDEFLDIRFVHEDTPLIINFEKATSSRYLKTKEFKIIDGIIVYRSLIPKTIIIPCELTYKIRSLIDTFDKKQIIEYLADIVPSSYDLNKVTITPMYDNIYDVQIFDKRSGNYVSIIELVLIYNHIVYLGIGLILIGIALWRM